MLIVALLRYADVRIFALVRASPHSALCDILAPLVDTRKSLIRAFCLRQ